VGKGALTAYLERIVAQLPERPKAMVVVSAHWKQPVPTVTTHPRPPIFYDERLPAGDVPDRVARAR